jgi:hypothetical protein
MFTLQQVVPWGRSFDEYRAMFALTDVDLEGRIFGCGDLAVCSHLLFSTARSSEIRFIARRFWSYAGSRGKCGSFHCFILMGGGGLLGWWDAAR